MALGLRFLDLVEQSRTGQPEALSGMQLGDQVVIVGIEILGHLAGGGRLSAGCSAPGHAKGRVQVHLAPGQFVFGAESRRHRPQQHRNIEHLVVEGEVTHGHQIEAGFSLRRPVAPAQLAPFGLEGLAIELALPVGFGGFLQFAVRADARITEYVCQRHGESRAV